MSSAPDPSSSSFSSSTRRIGVAVLLATVAIVLLSGFYHLFHVFLIAFAGVLLGVLLNGLAALLADRTPVPYRWSLGAVLLVSAGLIVGVSWLLAPSFVDQVQKLGSMLPEALKELRAALAGLPGGDALASYVPASVEELSKLKFLDLEMGAVFRTTTSVVSEMIIVFILGLFLAFDPKMYKAGLIRLVPVSERDCARDVLQHLASSLRSWFLGRFASMAIVGIVIGVGLWIMGIPLPIALGLLAGLLSFIPNIGPIISFIPAALIAWMHGGIPSVLYVLGLYVGGQTVESYLITPMLQQHLTSVPPALLLTAQVLLGVVGGIWGLVLATPLLVVTLILVRNIYVERVLERKGEEDAVAAHD